MCIRDSTIRAPFAGVVGLRLASPGQYVRPGDQIGTLDDTCLLYTSDAADERSSVDLGGRRIIKKKKHQQLDYSYTAQQENDSTTP